MKRIRWLSAKWPFLLRTLASKMKAYPFTQDYTDGFIIERVRDTFIEARYIEKLIYKETNIDPFGNTEVYDRVVYQQLAFNLFSDFPHIELYDAPRRTNTYFSKLLELTDFSLSIDPLQLNLLDWVEAFQSKINKDIIIDSMQIAGIKLEEGVNAKVLIKGNSDVRPALGQFIKNKQFTLEKLQLKLQFDKNIVHINLSNTGYARIHEEVIDDIVPLLRISIPNPSIPV